MQRKWTQNEAAVVPQQWPPELYLVHYLFDWKYNFNMQVPSRCTDCRKPLEEMARASGVKVSQTINTIKSNCYSILKYTKLEIAR